MLGINESYYVYSVIGQIKVIFRYFLSWVTLFCFFHATGQVIPVPGDTLNFTQIMFDHPPVVGADYYKLQVIERDKDSSFKHPLIEIIDSAPSVMLNNFEFGKKYLWRYAGFSHNKNTGWKGPYAFEITNEDSLNWHGFKAFVLNNDSSLNAHGLILVDCNPVAYDRNGRAVWYLTFRDTKRILNPATRDLRINSAGTVTYLLGKDAIECDLYGHQLWKAPKKDSATDERPIGQRELYHHDFKRLANGHYMVLAGLLTNRKLPSYIDTTKINIAGGKMRTPGLLVKRVNGLLYVSVSIGTIVEFDKAGKTVWQWDSEKYFTDEDLIPPGTDLSKPLEERDAHLNAFSVDEKNGFIYAGFRNISRVIKIDKQSGNVVYSWGNRSLSGEPGSGQGFFKRQHDAQILSDGNIAVFNNNTSEQKTSSAIIFSQGNGKDSSRINWFFDCNIDNVVKAKSYIGGNVDELPNKDLLICTGNTDRVFEVTRSKQVVWNAIVGRKKITDTMLTPNPLYRAHYVSSLYPCYFSVQQIKSINKGELRFKIFNTGTENDAYIINIKTTAGNNLKSPETIEVEAGKSVVYTFTKDNNRNGDERFKVTVQSKANLDFERSLELKE